jgi:MerR family copper efflux transcriptional regulator
MPNTEERAVNISQAAQASGISAKMIRHYESIGLLPKAARGQSGYRNFQDADVHRLMFVRRARDVGFATDAIKALLSLWQDARRPAREVRRLAQDHLRELEARIAELQAIAGTLSHLIEHCHGDERPECPILEAFDQHHSAAMPKTRKMRGGITPRVARR